MIQHPTHAAQPLYAEDGRRMATADNALRKTISFRTGLLLKPEPSISFELSHLDAAELQGVATAIVTNSDTGDRYAAPIEWIRKLGHRRTTPALQAALPVRLWDKIA